VELKGLVEPCDLKGELILFWVNLLVVLITLDLMIGSAIDFNEINS
jgi:hypothetical protein